MKTVPNAWRTIILTTVAVAGVVPPAEAQATTFDPRVITFGETREQIKNTPIPDRPYRPLHFYGNSVRRRQSRAPSGGQRMVQSR